MDTKEYSVEITEECQKEIRKVYAYISENLDAEISAKRMMRMIDEFINNLAYAPKMYAEIPPYTGTNMIYRRIVIKNYVLLYTIDELNKKVYISHLYYAGSDYLK